MAKNSPFVPSAVPLATPRSSHEWPFHIHEVEIFAVNVEPFCSVLVRLFTWSLGMRSNDNALYLQQSKDTSTHEAFDRRRRPDCIGLVLRIALSRSLRCRVHGVSMVSVGRWSLCILLVACLGGCIRNPEARKTKLPGKRQLILSKSQIPRSYRRISERDPDRSEICGCPLRSSEGLP